MSVRPNAEHLQIDTAGGANLFLVTQTEAWDVLRLPVRDMHIPFGDVDVSEKVLLHETVVRLRMFGCQPHIFVEVKGRYPAPIEVLSYQFTIQAQRCAAGGETEDCVGF